MKEQFEESGLYTKFRQDNRKGSFNSKRDVSLSKTGKKNWTKLFLYQFLI